MRNSFLFNLFVMLLLVFMTCRGTEIPKDQAELKAIAIESIKKNWHDFNELAQQGNATACAAFFTEDGVNMPSYNSTQIGRAEIETMLVNLFSSTKVEVISQTTNEVFVHDSMAYEFGFIEHKFQHQEEEPFIVKKRYLSVFKQQPDKSWKWYRWFAQNNK